VQEQREYPQVALVAAPNVPEGWRVNSRYCDVTVDIATHTTDDPDRTQCDSIYNTVRKVVDSSDLTDTAIHNIVLTVEASGTCMTDGNINLIELPVRVYACVVT
jgi:hypothetical protein